MAACIECGGRAQWVECPTGGWWSHEVHPEDGHDADVIGTHQDCLACNGQGGGQVRLGVDEWEYQPCDDCDGSGLRCICAPDSCAGEADGDARCIRCFDMDSEWPCPADCVESP